MRIRADIVVFLNRYNFVENTTHTPKLLVSIKSIKHLHIISETWVEEWYDLTMFSTGWLGVYGGVKDETENSNSAVNGPNMGGTSRLRCSTGRHVPKNPSHCAIVYRLLQILATVVETAVAPSAFPACVCWICAANNTVTASAVPVGCRCAASAEELVLICARHHKRRRSVLAKHSTRSAWPPVSPSAACSVYSARAAPSTMYFENPATSWFQNVNIIFHAVYKCSHKLWSIRSVLQLK